MIENTGAGMYPKDEVELEVDAQGGVTAYTVAHSQGQGHETTFAMMVAKALEIPAERVRVRQGVQGRTIIGNHTGGSRSMVGAGTVCHIAGEKLVQHGKSLAAEEMGLEPSQVSYAGGEFKGPDGKTLTLARARAEAPAHRQGRRHVRLDVPERLPHRRSRDRSRNGRHRDRLVPHRSTIAASS